MVDEKVPPTVKVRFGAESAAYAMSRPGPPKRALRTTDPSAPDRRTTNASESPRLAYVVDPNVIESSKDPTMTRLLPSSTSTPTQTWRGLGRRWGSARAAPPSAVARSGGPAFDRGPTPFEHRGALRP